MQYIVVQPRPAVEHRETLPAHQRTLAFPVHIARHANDVASSSVLGWHEATLLYDGNVRKWSHRQPKVRDALDDADAATGLEVTDTPGSHGHSWGYVDCTYPDCTQPMRRYYVNSTPRSQDDEAARIRRFIRKHEHKEEGRSVP
jgi:hypothetical protein